MGQAKVRGSYEERKSRAIREGRIKETKEKHDLECNLNDPDVLFAHLMLLTNPHMRKFLR